MSGALNSVFGGGGIFKALLSVASIAFPPLAIANSLSNLLVQGIGEAVKAAASTLVKELGMPRFIQNLVNTAVDQALPAQMRESSPEVDGFTQERFGNEVKDFASQLTSMMVESVRKSVQAEQEKNTKGTSGKSSATSWLSAMAQAMGEVLGAKAARMVELSDKLSDLNSSAVGLKGDAKEANARDMTKTQLDLQGVTQEFALLQSSLTNTIKSIGENLSQIGRKG